MTPDAFRAAAAAQEILADVGIDQHRRVDVYRLCELVGLWLNFTRLDNLLGAYLRDPVGPEGVLVTTERHQPLQRYTVAHEIGHWKLHRRDGTVVDRREQVLPGYHVYEPKELEAQVFAAHLLMPLPLVETLWQQHSTYSMPHRVYGVARGCGTSYEAAAHHLRRLEMVSAKEAATLRLVSPLALKAEVAQGKRPEDRHADVWSVNKAWDGVTLDVHQNDELLISLPEPRASGYRWVHPDDRLPAPAQPRLSRQQVGGATPTGLDDTLDSVPEETLEHLMDEIAEEVNEAGPIPRARERPAALHEIHSGWRGAAVVRDWHEPAGGERVGGAGTRQTLLRFTDGGDVAIRLHLAPPGDRAEVDTFQIDVVVHPSRDGVSLSQLVGRAA